MDTWQLQKLVKKIVRRESEIYDLIYFYGDKNRLQAILSDIESAYASRCPAKKVIHINAERFCNETLRNVQEGIWYTPQYDCELYIFENIEEIAGMESNEQRLYGMLDWLLENHRQIIVTGSVPTASIEKLAPRICAQLDGGISFCVEPV